MKLCSAVILYNPNAEDLKKSLRTLCRESNAVFLWQNSEIDLECKNIIESYSNAFLAGNAENIGIAGALNGCVRIAAEKKFTHILTMDQDSYFNCGVITYYKNKVLKFADDDTAIFGINPMQDNKTVYIKNDIPLEVSDTITSGSIFKIENFEKFGYFDDELFIDAVDYEYCYRLKRNFKQKTIVFPDVILNHCVGYVEKTRYGFNINNYSSFRTYFIVRNQLSVWRNYPDLFPKSHKITLLKDHILYRIIKIVLAEKNKMSKLSSIFTAVFHFLKDKKGYYRSTKI